MNFVDKLSQAIITNNSLLIVALDPNPEMLPSRFAHSSNLDGLIVKLEHWLTEIIEATFEQVCSYRPNLGFYQALGVGGMELLTTILKRIPHRLPVILDAKQADLNSSTLLAETIFNQWGVDALTVTPYAGQDLVAPFLVYPDKAVFVLSHTSNPGATNLQEYPDSNHPFYLQVVKEAKTWASPEQLGLEVGTNDPEVLAKIRAIAPERMILMRSIWGEGDNLEAILAAGLTENEDGLLIPVPQDLLGSDNLAPEIKSLNEQINRTRSKVIEEGSTCQLWTPDVCLLKQHPHQDLILQIYDLGCILFGEYVQASGATFSYYIDLRQIISHPQIFHQVVKAYAEIIKNLSFDRLAGIPYGSLPTATGLSMSLHSPMIFPRKEVKAHGTRRVIEGTFNPGEKVVVVDDILITGKSVMEGAEKLKSAGLEVEDIVVFIDHEEEVKNKLKKQGYNAYSVLTISEITETLYEAGRINQTQYQSLLKK
jgi:uridine monophosphate synthetase